MAFSFPAFSYIIALIVDAFLIFFSIFHVIAFDELKTDYKNPIDQCNSLNPVSKLPPNLYESLIFTPFNQCILITASSTRILTTFVDKCTVPAVGRMVFVVDKHPFNFIPYT